MRSLSIMLGMAGLVLTVGLTVALSNRQAVSAVKPQTTSLTTVPGKAPYRHQGHFLTSVQLTSTDPLDIFTNSVTVDGSVAKFTCDANSTVTADWDLYSQKVSKKNKKKLILVFVPRKPTNIGSLDAQTAGTGTIVITTTDPGTTTTTTTSIPVEPIDTDPCP
jgi:hypothetical protein